MDDVVDEVVQERWQQMYRDMVYNQFQSSINDYKEEKARQAFNYEDKNKQKLEKNNDNFKKGNKRQIFILDEEKNE